MRSAVRNVGRSPKRSVDDKTPRRRNRNPFATIHFRFVRSFINRKTPPPLHLLPEMNLGASTQIFQNRTLSMKCRPYGTPAHSVYVTQHSRAGLGRHSAPAGLKQNVPKNIHSLVRCYRIFESMRQGTRLRRASSRFLRRHSHHPFKCFAERRVGIVANGFCYLE